MFKRKAKKTELFERLTDPARHAISSAQDEAIALGHRWIGTEHLLLGLINVRDGMAGAVLDEWGVKVAAAREQKSAGARTSPSGRAG
ncbi:Clp protease N-terminal domain-containing protein [Lentzea tibetensis]|uniref:Clp protease N-terminal domain-containing protein n=1 Tax=Lentzea tibetensis TaxID=2591470 RepID=UPI00164795DA|nr:Clp protease N-terminal domain-containing protein [Lentzea tibetensis]